MYVFRPFSYKMTSLTGKNICNFHLSGCFLNVFFNLLYFVEKGNLFQLFCNLEYNFRIQILFLFFLLLLFMSASISIRRRTLFILLCTADGLSRVKSSSNILCFWSWLNFFLASYVAQTNEFCLI